MSNGRATNEEKRNLKHSTGASFGHISEDPGEWTPGTWTESTDEGPSTEGSICVSWGHRSPVALAEDVCQNTKANYLAMQNLTLKNSNYGPLASRCCSRVQAQRPCDGLRAAEPGRIREGRLPARPRVLHWPTQGIFLPTEVISFISRED